MHQFTFRREAKPNLTTIWAALIVLAVPAGVWAQANIGAVATGNGPFAEAVNPVTGKIYIANQNSNNVSVIDGATETISATVTTGSSPSAVALDPVTNKIYVANSGSNNVTVINGPDNTTATVTVGSNPVAVAVNTVSNKIYVVNKNGNSVTVINGADNSTATVTVGTAPTAVAINAVSNKIYVANFSGNNVTVINGADNSTATVAVGTGPAAVAVNAVTNKIYVANKTGNNVTVINGADNSTATVAAGTAPIALAVNPVSNKVYVANRDSNNVTVINGSDNSTVTVTADTSPVAVALDVVTNQIYVANSGNSDVTVINGADNTTKSVSAGPTPNAVAVNPVTNKIYIANSGGNNVSVIDGATNRTTSLTTTGLPEAVNLVTNKIYAANGSGVTVINGADNSTTTVAIGAFVLGIAVNPVTNKIYVTSVSHDLTVIDGASNATTTIPGTSGGSGIAVNPSTNKIYLAHGNQVQVIAGASLGITTVPVSFALGIAVNPATNKVYVTDAGAPGHVNVIDGATNTVTATITAGVVPRNVVVNPVTNKIYALNTGTCNFNVCGPSSLTVIDGATNTATNVPVIQCQCAPVLGLTVNSVANKIYITAADFTRVIDGATNAILAMLPVGSDLAVNPTANKVYSGGIFEIDGATNVSTPLGLIAGSPLVNPVTNKVYLTDFNNHNNITALAEQQVNAIPLTTAIAPLPDNVTVNPTPVFTFTTSSSYAPIAPAVQNVYYQVDTWQGPWLQASGTSSTFTGQLPALQLGTHILFAYATDAQQGDSLEPGNSSGGQSSPVIGQIAAYAFTVTGDDTVMTLSSSANPAMFTTPVTFAVTLTSSKGTPSGSVAFFDGPTLLGTGTLDGSGVATFAISSLSVGTHSVVATFSGGGGFSPQTSNTVLQLITGFPTSTTAPTSGTNPSASGSSVTFSATVSSSFPGPLTGTVNFFECCFISLGTVPLISGNATLTTSSVDPGVRSIIAVYNGNGSFLSSTSPAFMQVVYWVGSGADTTTALTLTSGTNPSGFGDTLSFTAAVSSPSGPPIETSVAFMEGTTVLATAIPSFSGVASFTTSSLSSGTHSITATYTGVSGFFKGSTSLALNQTVKASSNTSQPVASANPSAFGQNVTFAARVTSQFAGTPTGTVTFLDGNTSLATAALISGSSTFSTTALSVGSHAITAVYSGDATFTSSVSPVLSQAVVAAGTNTALALTAGANPSGSGSSLTFTATVSPSFQGTPTGTVTFMDGVSTLGTGTPGAPGIWTFSTASLAAGSHSITAVYGGDTNFDGSTSPVFSEVVQSGGSATTTALTVNDTNSATIYFGTAVGVPQAANFVVTLTPNTATGSVVLLEGNQQLGPGLILSGGQASYATQLSVGQHMIEAVYIGDGANAGSTSPTVVINRSPRPKPR